MTSFSKWFGAESPEQRLKRAEEYIRKEEYEKAKAEFAALRMTDREGEMSAKLGRIDEALQLFSKAGKPILAAQLLIQEERFDEAARWFERGNRFLDAAQLWTKLGRIDEAAICFEKVGAFSTAADLLEKAHRYEDAAKILIRSTHQGFKNETRSLWDRAGMLYEKAGNYIEAVKCYRSGRNIAKEAHCLRRLGQAELAAELYLEVNDQRQALDALIEGKKYERALELCEECGDEETARMLYRLLGRDVEALRIEAKNSLEKGERRKAAEKLERAGELVEAAAIYDDIGEFLRAAELWEKAAHFDEAAGAYERTGAKEKAAELYSLSGNHRKSAELFEHVGKKERAAGEYELSENWEEAGRVHIESNQADLAIRAFQKIPPLSPNFMNAQHQLANIFLVKHDLAMAGQHFSFLEGLSISPTSIDMFYDYARYLEEKGDLKKALELYEKLLVVDFHHRDLVVRKRDLEEKIKNKGDAKPNVSDRYVLGKELGAGGMGRVFKARDISLGRDVAVKVLPTTLSRRAEDEERFVREGRLAAKLAHPNIVAVYDVGKHKDTLFLVMEYVEGEDLKRRIERLGTLSIPEIISFGVQIGRALEHAHEHGVIHRDVKSANILIAENKIAKLSDFGVARAMKGSLSTVTQNVGSPYYMAPEQVAGNSYDHRVDLYSMGIVLYEMITGAPPFTEGEIGYHHVHTEPKPPGQTVKDVPVQLEEIVMTLLEKSPGDRFYSAQEVISALET